MSPRNRNQIRRFYSITNLLPQIGSPVESRKTKFSGGTRVVPILDCEPRRVSGRSALFLRFAIEPGTISRQYHIETGRNTVVVITVTYRQESAERITQDFDDFINSIRFQ